MQTKLQTITITDDNDKFLIVKEPSLSWFNKNVQAELKQLDVIFDGGCHAVKIVPRKMNNPLFALGMEDDNTICFEKYQGRYSYAFDMGWSNDLIRVVNEAINAYALDRKIQKETQENMER